MTKCNLLSRVPRCVVVDHDGPKMYIFIQYYNKISAKKAHISLRRSICICDYKKRYCIFISYFWAKNSGCELVNLHGCSK